MRSKSTDADFGDVLRTDAHEKERKELRGRVDVASLEDLLDQELGSTLGDILRKFSGTCDRVNRDLSTCCRFSDEDDAISRRT